jgi:hypothetical protein
MNRRDLRCGGRSPKSAAWKQELALISDERGRAIAVPRAGFTHLIVPAAARSIGSEAGWAINLPLKQCYRLHHKAVALCSPSRRNNMENTLTVASMRRLSSPQALSSRGPHRKARV